MSGNAQDRRRARRRRGIRAPYRCFWCESSLTAWDGACKCPTLGRPRKPWVEMTPRDLAGTAHRFGVRLSVEVAERDEQATLGAP